MATLVYSKQCKFCDEVIQYIKQTPSLHSIVTFHDVSQGVPDYIKVVPSLVTNDQKMFEGKHVKLVLEKWGYVPPRGMSMSKKSLAYKPSLLKLSEFGNHVVQPKNDPRIQGDGSQLKRTE